MERGHANARIVQKGDSVTRSERYLRALCDRTFLSLWSYPAIYRDQGGSSKGGDGKEVCDLLVVFGSHVLIFSDKECSFPQTGELTADWKRWFKRAVAKSAKQAWGAERWIRDHPSRLYLDKKCQQPLPLDIPPKDTSKFHLIVVAHGVSRLIQQHFGGGSGSLLIDSSIQGGDAHVSPFTVGDLSPSRTFVHIFDEESLQTVMSTRDTISDFVTYLEKRAAFLRGVPKVLATGEEEILAIYLKNMNANGEHDFVLPPRAVKEPVDKVAILEGGWESFCKNPQRLTQIVHDRISYSWDALIEKFNYYALRGEQYRVSEGGLRDSERILRFMAREPRYKRRYLARGIHEMLATTPPEQRRIRVLPPVQEGDPHYVFLVFPHPSKVGRTEAEYREVRGNFLHACCMVVKLQIPNATDIVGVATEAGIDTEPRSEDAVYLDARDWNDELNEEAGRLQRDLKILVKPEEIHVQISEYPEQSRGLRALVKVGRNAPCPCGSGKKFKRCCL